MDKPLCAYCKLPSTLTKEHLFPGALHRRQEAANNEKLSYWLAKVGKEISAQPQIKDVCSKCNSGELSMLDSYVCSLYDQFMVPITARHSIVSFEFDYHLLKRWLLKICFNSARIHNSVDLKDLERLLPYILGKDDHMGRSAQLFLQLSYPQEVPREFFNPGFDSDEPVFLSPDSNRVGYLFFNAHEEGRKIMRSVFLRSYTFFLALWPRGNQVLAQNHFSTVVERQISGTVLLRKSQPRVELECDGMGAWDSWKYSHQNPKEFFDIKE